jgi:hypothetical protein
MSVRIAIAVLVIAMTVPAQDLRNLGMGRLSALLESDIHRIALYDFGENPAGLLSAAPPTRGAGPEQNDGSPVSSPWGSEENAAGYTVSEAFLSGWGIHPRGDSHPFPIWSVGQPLPADFQDIVPLGALGIAGRQIFPSRPAGGYLRQSDGSFALAARGCWSHFEGNGQATVNVPELGFEAANRLTGLDVGYRAVAFYGMGNQYGGSAQYLGVEGGAGVAVPGEILSGGACVDYYHPMYHVKYGSFFDTTYHSNAARGRGALVLQPIDTLKLGLKAGYTWADIMQTRTLTPAAGMRALYEPAGVPLAAGLEAAWMKATPYHHGETGSSYDSLYLGGGLGLRLPVLFLGAEVQRTAWGSNNTDARAEHSRLSLNFGAEVNFGVAHVRAGFLQATGKGSEGYADTLRCYTGGLGFDLEGLWVDVAYNLEVPGRSAYEHMLQLSVKFTGAGD